MGHRNSNAATPESWQICMHIKDGSAADACLGSDHIAVCMPCAIAFKDKSDQLHTVSAEDLRSRLERMDTVLGWEYLCPADPTGHGCRSARRERPDRPNEPGPTTGGSDTPRCGFSGSRKARHHRDFGHPLTIFETYDFFLKSLRCAAANPCPKRSGMWTRLSGVLF
jgi:hypothetical protein